MNNTGQDITLESLKQRAERNERVKTSNNLNGSMIAFAKKNVARYVTPKNPFKVGDVVGHRRSNQVGEVIAVFGKWVKFSVHGSHKTVRFGYRTLELVMSYNDRIRMAHYLQKEATKKTGVVQKTMAWVRRLVKLPEPERR